MRKLFVIVLVLFSSSVMAEPRIEGTVKELKTYFANANRIVTLSASASKKVSYKTASVQLRVRTENPQLATAIEANTNIRTRLRTLLKAAALTDKEIKEASFSALPAPGTSKKKSGSNRVDNIVTVTVKSEKQLAKVISIARKQKGVAFLSAIPEVGDESKIESALLKAALLNAKAKAKVYRENLKVRMIVESFEEVSFDSREIGGTPVPVKSKLGSFSSTPQNLQFGEREYSLQLNVNYKILAGKK